MAVAIRAITRVQDADDAPALGAGQDGYALTWSNAMGAFVATALFSGGLLATGATTGATVQTQVFTNGVSAPGSAADGERFGAGALASANSTAVGSSASANNATGGCVALGKSSNASGAFATAYGNAATASGDRANAIGMNSVSSGSASIAIGFAANAGHNNSIALGRSATATKTNQMVVGNTTYPINEVLVVGNTALTNTVQTMLILSHDTSGTAAAGFGAGLAFQLESSTTAAQNAALVSALWYEATHASRKADLVLSAYDTAVREGLRIRGAGSAAAIGFLGATPQARIAHVADPSGGATVDAEGRSAINSILSTLELFGFHAAS